MYVSVDRGNLDLMTEVRIINHHFVSKMHQDYQSYIDCPLPLFW